MTTTGHERVRPWTEGRTGAPESLPIRCRDESVDGGAAELYALVRPG